MKNPDNNNSAAEGDGEGKGKSRWRGGTHTHLNPRQALSNTKPSFSSVHNQPPTRDPASNSVTLHLLLLLPTLVQGRKSNGRGKGGLKLMASRERKGAEAQNARMHTHTNTRTDGA
jgi:hypothetical protein